MMNENYENMNYLFTLSYQSENVANYRSLATLRQYSMFIVEITILKTSYL